MAAAKLDPHRRGLPDRHGDLCVRHPPAGPDSCKELFEELVRLLRSRVQPRGFPVAGVAEERRCPAPQRTVCRTGVAYYSSPRCFACSIVS